MAMDALVAGLAINGVERVVVSPGARSTPLVLACMRHRGLRLHVLPDERSAAFFALGITKATGVPGAVIATSGTAPAHWYPAVIEADQDHQPLILLSADRPNELHGCGANQTVDQQRMFGTHARAYFDLSGPEGPEARARLAAAAGARAVAESRGPVPGPVQINVPLREPLVPDPLPDPPGAIGAPRVIRDGRQVCDEAVAALAARLSGRRGIIVAGRLPRSVGLARAVTGLAQTLACPVFADPLSGLRFGRHDRGRLIRGYDLLLESVHGAGSPPAEWALILGEAPVSRALQRLVSGVREQIVVAPYSPWPDPERGATQVIQGDAAQVCERLARYSLESAEPSWMEGFEQAVSRLDALLGAEPGGLPVEAGILRALFDACPEGTQVFCANSMVIRDVDAFVPGHGREITLVGNRGASGIDGNVSTVLGMAAARSGPVVGVLGDLAFYHDMNGLLAAREVDATLILFNNGGGGIFSYLPQARLEGFERYWRTPVDLDFARAAALYGLGHERVSEAAGFERAFRAALKRPGVNLIEVEIDHRHSVARHLGLRRALAGI